MTSTAETVCEYYGSKRNVQTSVEYDGKRLRTVSMERSHPNTVDRTGQRYGKLIARYRVEPFTPVHWLCTCDCGNLAVVRGDMLGTETNSCGCIRRNRALAKPRGANGRYRKVCVQSVVRRV